MPEPIFDFSQLSPDADKKDGVWTPCVLTLPGGRRVDTGAELLIAYSGDNEALAARRASLVGKLQRAANGQPINVLLLENANRKALVGTVLKGWRGFRLGGKEVEFSPKAAEEEMLRHGAFTEFVAEFAAKLENFRADLADPDTADDEAAATPDPESEGEPEAHAALKSGDSLG